MRKLATPIDWKGHPEWERTLREMFALGYSFTNIAAKIGNGVTRSAVAGKRKRLGLKRITNVVSAPKPGTKRGKPQPPPEGPVIECPGGLTITELKPMFAEGAQCRWPIGHPRSPDFRYCGRQPLGWQKYSERLSPYCKEHTAEAYQPPGKGPSDAE